MCMLASCKGSNDAGGVQRGLEGFGMFSGAFVLARPKLSDMNLFSDLVKFKVTFSKPSSWQNVLFTFCAR